MSVGRSVRTMDSNKIGSFIREKRKEKGFTQEELANRLFVTEKAVSKWETGRGIPDISLLVPLAQELGVEVSEILGGEVKSAEVERVIEYAKTNKKFKSDWKFLFSIVCILLSVLTFLSYLRFEYDPRIEVNYFIRLGFLVVASVLVFLGNKMYSDHFVETLEDKRRTERFSMMVLFLYYVVFLFNVVLFARYVNVSSYNLIPFASIIEILRQGNLYQIVINLFGNFFVFMPLEFFLFYLFGMQKCFFHFLLSFFILLSIEVAQFVFRLGVFDVDDIFLSLLGMVCLYFVFVKRKKSSK